MTQHIPQGEGLFDADRSGFVALEVMVTDLEWQIGYKARYFVLVTILFTTDGFSIRGFEHVAFAVVDAEVVRGHVRTEGLVLAE